MMGHEVSAATRQLLSQRAAEFNARPDVKQRQIESHTGKAFSDTHCLHISQANKGRNTWSRGRTASLVVRAKLSASKKRAWSNPTSRKRYIDALAKTQWLNVRTDVGQVELLEKWNRLGFHFEPNYQMNTDTALFYLDGYDKTHNVVVEYDSYYHKRHKQHLKDMVRQDIIIDVLKPKKFWRYDAVNKQWNDVMQERN